MTAIVDGRDYAGQCAGKVKFESAVLAHRAARRARLTKVRTAYRCPHCGRWHIGSSAWAPK